MLRMKNFPDDEGFVHQAANAFDGLNIIREKNSKSESKQTSMKIYEIAAPKDGYKISTPFQLSTEVTAQAKKLSKFSIDSLLASDDGCKDDEDFSYGKDILSFNEQKSLNAAHFFNQTVHQEIAKEQFIRHGSESLHQLPPPCFATSLSQAHPYILENKENCLHHFQKSVPVQEMAFPTLAGLEHIPFHEGIAHRPSAFPSSHFCLNSHFPALPITWWSNEAVLRSINELAGETVFCNLFVASWLACIIKTTIKDALMSFMHHCHVYVYNVKWLVTPTSCVVPFARKRRPAPQTTRDSPGRRRKSEWNLTEQYI